MWQSIYDIKKKRIEVAEDKTFNMIIKKIIHKRLHNQYSGFLQDTKHEVTEKPPKKVCIHIFNW